MWVGSKWTVHRLYLSVSDRFYQFRIDSIGFRLILSVSDRFFRFGSILSVSVPDRFYRISDRFYRVSDRFYLISDRFYRVSDRFYRVSGRFYRISARFYRFRIDPDHLDLSQHSSSFFLLVLDPLDTMTMAANSSQHQATSRQPDT